MQPARSPSTAQVAAEPDFIAIQSELKTKCMTLQLLWEEYAEAHPDDHYNYSRFTVLYPQWRDKQQLPMRKDNYIFALTPPGFGHEPGHLYSDEAYLGEGLHEAVQQALEYLPEPMKVGRLYSSTNGESYWVKELGIAMTRASHRLHDLQHEHPANTYGDIGAATGAVLISLAADHAFRAAVCLIPEKIEP